MSRYSSKQVDEYFAEYKKSVLSIAAFARKHQLPTPNVYSWFRVRKGKTSEIPTGFIPAVIKPSYLPAPYGKGNNLGPVKLQVGDRALVEIPLDVSPQWLATLLRGLG